MTTTGNAGGCHNLILKPGREDLNGLIRGLKRGLLVTELLGQGVNYVNGDYSRGAAGYWIENGEIVHPVEEITIAGNLKDMEDPNPLVSGQGLARIGAAGIATAAGLLAEQARELNIGFIARMTRGRPWLRLKGAASLDGRTALANGASQWITGPAARQDGHRWRARACAILTGSGTVLADDPQLTVRGVATERQPLRVVVDSRLVTPGNARILQGGGTLVVTACEDGAKARSLQDQGAEVLVLPGADGRVDLPGLLAELGRRGLNEVHAGNGIGDELLILHRLHVALFDGIEDFREGAQLFHRQARPVFLFRHGAGFGIH